MKEAVFSLIPVILFLIGLFLLDSFKLVRKSLLILSIIWGLAAAVSAYYLNTFLANQLNLSFDIFSQWIAPFIEEILKIAIIIFLIGQKKIGFTIDAAIYGFASGTGFSLAENSFYLMELEASNNFIVFLLRGFGTALMHGGCTSLAAMMMLAGVQRDKHYTLALLPSLLLAIVIHGGFNRFWLNPVLQTALIFFTLPMIFILLFQRSNHLMQDWLEIEFSSEVALLAMIKKGHFRRTKAGEYLMNLKQYFEPELMVDLYCYLSLYLELSIISKRNIMLKEQGFQIGKETGIEEKLNELHQLRHHIGKTGIIALQPLVRIRYRELWKLNQLKSL